MKAYYFPAALISLLFLVACNKDDDNTGGDTKLLTEITTTSDMDTIRFKYNSNDQITQVESVSELSTIAINGDQLHYVEYRKYESRTVVDATFTLNAQGNIVSGQGSFSYNIAGPYTSQFSFTYDAAGNLTNRTETHNDGMVYSFDFTWSNGDNTAKIWKLNGVLSLTQFKEYDTSLEDKNQLDANKFFTYTNSFLGNSSKHLLKRTYAINAPGSTITQDISYAFAIDSKGYPTTMTLTGITNPFTDVYTFHYL